MAATVPTIGRVAKAATSSAVLDFLKNPKQPLIGASGFPPSLHSSIQFDNTAQIRRIGDRPAKCESRFGTRPPEARHICRFQTLPTASQADSTFF